MMFNETFGEEQRADVNSSYDPLDNVPDDLKARSQWVVWKYEDNGKPKADKVLYGVNP
ncbi:MAG TPA: hypothetical protein VKJ47_12985 [Candidatus Binatia bacterium]|nr:hypothetical protein [Candidatus Binatia bacterium]